MPPESTVEQLAIIVSERREFSEDEIYSAMASAGIPDKEADRAFKFTQTAWGRAFLAKLGVRFSPGYLCFDAGGDVMEFGNLEDEPNYAAAWKLAPRFQGSPGFQRLAFMSADFHAINKLLLGGSKAKDLVTTPVYLFLERPTKAGMERAKQVIAKHMQSSQVTHPVRRPWWRFW